ncbi:MAG: hypothetical protein RIQ41_562 [Candidatus Parcubacteria bacterium]|jgi:sugar-specific transcriptional regulator TrmB
MPYDLDDILQSLGLAPSSQKIYRELLRHGETTARLLSERLGITRPSTYDHLATLVKRGLVVEKQQGSTTYFAADDVRHVERELDESIERLTEHKKAFSGMLPTLLASSALDSPKIKFYEGKEGLTHLVNDVLFARGETVCTVWPHSEMVRVLGKEILLRFNKRRLQEKIHIKALWPHTSHKESLWDDDTHITRKHMPTGTVFRMGYTIYGDKVSFISSHREVFGFIVQSKDFAELMRSQFDIIWSVSKK